MKNTGFRPSGFERKQKTKFFFHNLVAAAVVFVAVVVVAVAVVVVAVAVVVAAVVVVVAVVVVAEAIGAVVTPMHNNK